MVNGSHVVVQRLRGCCQTLDAGSERASALHDTANMDCVQITVNDLPVGRSVDETLRLIDAFQFTDKYGEVCPANWNPGQDTIKATPEGNKAYLDKVHADTKMADMNGTGKTTVTTINGH